MLAAAKAHKKKKAKELANFASATLRPPLTGQDLALGAAMLTGTAAALTGPDAE